MQLKAFPDQDHDAHISTHLSYMSSQIVRANPAMINILQQHIFEHIGMKASMQVQMEAQQGMDPNMLQNRLAQVEAELTAQYFEQEAQVLGSGQRDPLVDLKAKELQLKEQAQMQEAMNDAEQLKLNKEKLQANTCASCSKY